VFDNVPDGYIGFIYLITRLHDIEDGNPVKYVGKKNFVITKRVGRSGRKVKSVQLHESDWRTYYGSSNLLNADIEKFGRENFHRQILHLCTSSLDMTYLEIVEQIERNVLATDSSGYKEYYNGNILGKFYSTDSKDQLLLKLQDYRFTDDVTGNQKGKR
jgi:hypothetical protein